MKHPLRWPLKWRHRAVDLHLEGLAPWRIRAIIEIESERRLPPVTLWKWIKADA